MAKYERHPGGKGVLRIKRSGREMVDVVVATGVTMQYSWNHTKKLRSAGMWRKDRVSTIAGLGAGADLGVTIAGGLRRSETPGQG